MKTNLKNKGFSLIEIISFIVVIGISITGALISLQHTAQYSATPNALIQAQSLAQSHFAFTQLSRHMNGFNGVHDICSSAPSLAACLKVNSYAQAHGFIVSATTSINQNGRKQVTISVSGKAAYQLLYEAVNYEGA